MLKPENVATPLPSATDAVPESVPPPGLVPTASVTVPLKSVTTVPAESTAATVNVPSDPPVCADCGWAVNWREVAIGGGGGSAVMSKAVLVAPVSPNALAVRVYPVPALSILRDEKPAMPLAAATTRVPLSVPALG